MHRKSHQNRNFTSQIIIKRTSKYKEASTEFRKANYDTFISGQQHIHELTSPEIDINHKSMHKSIYQLKLFFQKKRSIHAINQKFTLKALVSSINNLIQETDII